MSTVDEVTSAEQSADASATVAPPATVERPPADRFMRKLLRIKDVERSNKTKRLAHRNFQIAMIITGIRCTITYLLIPIFVPIIGLSGMVSAPIGIVLSLVAILTGISSLRQFWRSDHRYRWMYTAFIGVVFAVVAIALTVDISTLVGQL